MLLIGSAAAHVHHPRLWPTRGDIDVVCEWDDFRVFIDNHGIEATPLRKNHFVGEGLGGMVEFEIAWPGTSGAELLERVSARFMRPFYGGHPDVLMLVPTMDWLFTLKASHRYRKNDPHFLKTLRDYHRMKYELGCEIADPEWLAMREAETYIKRRPRLNTSKGEFFTDATLTYVYDHDTLHIAVAQGNLPAYESYKADDAEVFCSRKKWDACSEETKLNGVLEETYVLALERSQIPHGDKISPRDSFLIALSKVCTSITSGWFREYAYENYYRVLDLYSDEYVAKFKRGLQEGVVLEVKEHGQTDSLGTT